MKAKVEGIMGAHSGAAVVPPPGGEGEHLRPDIAVVERRPIGDRRKRTRLGSEGDLLAVVIAEDGGDLRVEGRIGVVGAELSRGDVGEEFGGMISGKGGMALLAGGGELPIGVPQVGSGVGVENDLVGLAPDGTPLVIVAGEGVDSFEAGGANRSHASGGGGGREVALGAVTKRCDERELGPGFGQVDVKTNERRWEGGIKDLFG